MLNTIKCHQIPVLSDNYIYVITIQDKAIIIDPAVGEDALEFCQKNQYTITHILNTHHHPDHVGGNKIIKQQTNCTIIGAAHDKERIPYIDIGVSEGTPLNIHNIAFNILELSGHTIGHIAYHQADKDWLFCGDTLFSLGCGYLFEGSYAQMLESLQKIMALPDDTLIHCAHEYTLNNGRFIESLQLNNTDFAAYYKEVQCKRAQNIPTVPSLLRNEKKCNIFLQTHNATYQHHFKKADSLTLFAHIRQLKNNFQ